MESTSFAIDAGVIRCICGFDDDDGFTIQCEKCNAWQHGQCVDIYRDAEVPDTYYCSECSDRKVNAQAAIQRQIKRREKEASEGRKKRSKSVKFRNGEDLSIKNGNTISKAATPKIPGTPKIENITLPEGLEKSALSRKKKRRLTVQESQFGGPSREGSDSDTDVEFFVATKSPDGKESNSGFTKSYKRYRDAHKIYHVHSSTSVYTSTRVREEIEKVFDMNLEDEICSYFTAQEYERIQAVRVMVRPTTNSASSNKFKFNGFSQFGLYTHPDGPSISRGRYITDLTGELLLRSEYKARPLNQYRFFGCPKPGVLFIPGLNIAVDGRLIGNEGVFLRPNCRSPNTRISTVIVAGKKVRFAVFASDTVKPGEELTIPWEFDAKHPIQKVFRGETVFSDAEKLCLFNTRNSILQRGMQCGCRSPQDCFLTTLKNIQNEIISNTTEASIPAIPGFSAREQRKLQGALSLIDKMSAQANKKRKRESLTVLARRPQKIKIDPSDSESDHESAENKSYPLSFKQQMRQKFLIARVDLDSRPRPPVLDEKEFDISPILSRSESPIASPPTQNKTSFPLTKTVSSAATVSSATPKIAAMTTNSAGLSNAVDTPKMVKKLSFADYIKSKRK